MHIEAAQHHHKPHLHRHLPFAGRKQPGRAELSYLRGAAYLEAGDAGQALRDARCAIVFGPRAGPAAEERTPEADAGDAGEEGWGAASPWLTAARSSLWPAALGLLGAAYEATGDNVRALLLACLAAEGAGGHEREGSDEGAGGACPEVPAVVGSSAKGAVCGGPEEGQDGGGLESGQQEESVHEAARRRLLRRVPEECVAAVRARGSAGLLALLSAAHTQAKPEVLRRRPKYYYYYEWMKKRILEQARPLGWRRGEGSRVWLGDGGCRGGCMQGGLHAGVPSSGEEVQDLRGRCGMLKS